MRRHWFFISPALLLFGMLVLASRQEHPQRGQFNVIMLTVESLRRDMITTTNTPNFIEHSRNALVFHHHRAISAWTGTNIVSLLTGMSPFHHGVHTRGQSVDPRPKLYLEQLADTGYRVEGIQPFMAMDIYRNLGITVVPAAPDVLVHLADLKLAEKPFFLWYHYLQTHLPYSGDLPENANEEQAARLNKVRNQTSIHFDEAQFSLEDQRDIQHLQSNSVREFDRWFDILYDFFMAGGFARDTILIVTADHGDEHGERGMVGHASTTLAGHLHEEVINVPLVIFLPERLRKKIPSSRHDAFSSHPDIMATIAALLDHEPATVIDGSNLAAPVKPDNWTGMTSSGGFNEPDPDNIRYFEYASLVSPWKMRLRIENNGQTTTFLYNLQSDPHEQHDLAAARPDLVNHHHDLLLPFIESQRRIERRRIEVIGDDIPAPAWMVPARSETFTYAQLKGSFYLQWHGDNHKTYVLEYRVGTGKNSIQGELEVAATRKDFGRIDKRYWNTWIVPHSPFQVRVRDKESGNWSPWLILEAKP